MRYQHLIDNMTTEIYASLKTAIEIGKWPNGVCLTDTQQALCMEAVLRWQASHLASDQHTGYIADRCASTSDVDRLIVLSDGDENTG